MEIDENLQNPTIIFKYYKISNKIRKRDDILIIKAKQRRLECYRAYRNFANDRVQFPF